MPAIDRNGLKHLAALGVATGGHDIAVNREEIVILATGTASKRLDDV